MLKLYAPYGFELCNSEIRSPPPKERYKATAKVLYGYSKSTGVESTEEARKRSKRPWIGSLKVFIACLMWLLDEAQEEALTQGAPEKHWRIERSYRPSF
jgi:hypothetical protein